MINQVEVKFVWQISYPPSQGNYFQPKSYKLAVFGEKTGSQKQLWQPKLQTFFQMVFASGQMKDQIILGAGRFFLSVKFATSPLASLAGYYNESKI